MGTSEETLIDVEVCTCKGMAAEGCAVDEEGTVGAVVATDTWLASAVDSCILETTFVISSVADFSGDNAVVMMTGSGTGLAFADVTVGGILTVSSAGVERVIDVVCCLEDAAPAQANTWTPSVAGDVVTVTVFSLLTVITLADVVVGGVIQTRTGATEDILVTETATTGACVAISAVSTGEEGAVSAAGDEVVDTSGVVEVSDITGPEVGTVFGFVVSDELAFTLGTYVIVVGADVKDGFGEAEGRIVAVAFSTTAEADVTVAGTEVEGRSGENIDGFAAAAEAVWVSAKVGVKVVGADVNIGFDKPFGGHVAKTFWVSATVEVAVAALDVEDNKEEACTKSFPPVVLSGSALAVVVVTAGAIPPVANTESVAVATDVAATLVETVLEDETVECVIAAGVEALVESGSVVFTIVETDDSGSTGGGEAAETTGVGLTPGGADVTGMACGHEVVVVGVAVTGIAADVETWLPTVAGAKLNDCVEPAVGSATPVRSVTGPWIKSETGVV